MGKISRYKIQVDGVTYRVSVEDESGEVAEVSKLEPVQAAVTTQHESVPESEREPARERVAITSLLPGNVYDVLCQEGDEVKEGDSLLILEAMKMQSPIYASQNGVVDSVEVQKGDIIRAGQPLVYLV